MSAGRPKVNVNPFAQPSALWRLDFEVPAEFVLPLEEALADLALATSSFEAPEDPSRWTVQLLTSQPPGQAELHRRLHVLAKNCDVPVPQAQVSQVMQQDWAAVVARDFPPLSIGRFFVHGRHARPLRPANALPIQVEAGMAFGSGEHATTSGCLQVIDRLAKRNAAYRVLDMGCGSAILAIAAARCWPQARVLAVDIDPVSVRIARENIRINGVSGQVRAVAGNGYDAAEIKSAKPFDLILSNILARPLVAFARDLAVHLAPGGTAVLSGLLSGQECAVFAAHRRQGLVLKGRVVQAGWTTLMVKK